MPKPDATTDRIVIVGAGLVGSLLAVFLARRGFKIEMLERRPDPRVGGAERGRSINLAISARGLHALNQVGLKEKALSLAIPMPGRRVHLRDGSTQFQAYGQSPEEAIRSISRSELNEMLLSEAEKTGRVRIRFGTRVTDYDLESSTLRFQTQDGKEGALRASPVFGTDGSSSALRSALMGLPGAALSEVPLDYGYKELSFPPAPGGGFRAEKNALHIWPRETYMLIALPNLDGSFTVTLFLAYEGDPSFSQLRTPRDAREFFQKDFPDALELLPDLEKDFFDHPTGHMVTVKSAPWQHEGKCLLLGDASHAIVPFFGQGMNAGFEDLSVLNQILGENLDPDWTRVFQELEKLRKEHTDAIADLAVENFVEMRDKVADPEFQKERLIEKRLEKEFPELYMSRYRMVSFSRIPYGIALEAGKIENRILRDLSKRYPDAGSVDLDYARERIERELAPLLKSHLDGA